MSDFTQLLLAVVAAITGGGALAARGHLTIHLRRRPGQPGQNGSQK